MTLPSYLIRTESQFLRNKQCFGQLSVPESPYRDGSDDLDYCSDGVADPPEIAIGRAALIVLPPGPEQARCYRLMREIAVMLASHGVPTLRLELSGTGNTVGRLATTGLSDWHADVQAAAEELRGRWPTAELFGIGVRYSARLLLDSLVKSGPSHAAGNGQLDVLVCLAPLLRGCEWVAHLQRVQAEMRADGVMLDERDLAGQPWPERLLADAAAQVTPPDIASLPFQSVYILESNSRLEDYIQYNHIVIDLNSNDWSSSSLPALVSAKAATAVLDVLSTPVSDRKSVSQVGAPAMRKTHLELRQDNVANEQPFRLGSSQCASLPLGQGLYGFYRSGRAACPVVVMLNSGLLDCAGPYGLYVDLAARLSQQGIASVRLDFSGKGESARKSVSGRDAVLDDYAQLSDFLRTQGHQQTILLGICSGADDALELAHLTNNVAGLVLLDGFAPKTLAYVRHYWQTRLTSPARMAGWLWRKTQALFSTSSSALQTAALSSQSAPQGTIDLRRWLAPDAMCARYTEVLERQCTTLALFTGSLQDDYYNHANQLSHALGVTTGLTELYRPHLGHLYPASNQREELFDLIVAWMNANYLSTAGKLEDNSDV